MNYSDQADLSFAESNNGQLRWWRASFQLRWDKKTTPEWHYGPLLAEQVIRPVLKRYEQDIQLWRFHRRAGLDAAGHRFSFLYYSDQRSAEKIRDEIEKNASLAELRKKGALLTVEIKPYGQQGGKGISATSDPHWTTNMQKTWPYFLMGVSRMWLEQVVVISEQVALASDLEKEWLSQSEESDHSAHYQSVQSALSRLWREEGNHAYFHHLNAIYAYQPVLQRF